MGDINLNISIDFDRTPAVLKKLESAISAVVRTGAVKIQNRWRVKLQQPGTGRVYVSRRNAPAGESAQAGLFGKPRRSRQNVILHRASAPGEPPATDTSNLVNSIFVRIEQAGQRAIIGTPVDYAPDLEFGTERIAPRPAAQPSVDEELPKIKAGLLKRIAEITR